MADSEIVKVEGSALAAYGSRDDVKELATRLQKFMPGGEKLTPEEAMAGAQYALSIGANPLNGEVYIFKDWKGKLITVEGYKLLERWARRQCNYMSRETTPPDNELSEGDIAVRMWILRDDMRPALRDLVDMGAPWGEAFETVATYADGVIGKDERFTRDGKAIAPPKGWTWHQKARVRALKNAIRQAYGMPSLAEIAAMSWESDGVQTEPDDWRGAEQYDRRGAEALARERAIRREAEPLTAEDKAAGAAALFGQVLEAETVEPEPEATAEPQKQQEQRSPQAPPRPWLPDEVKYRATTSIAAQEHDGRPILDIDKKRFAVVSNLELCFVGDAHSDQKRHAVIHYLTGKLSSKELSEYEVMALHRWLHATKDDSGDWHPDPLAVKEANMIAEAAMKDAGQTSMLDIMHDDDAAGRATIAELQAEADAVAATLTPPEF
jgi:hypothetical protein